MTWPVVILNGPDLNQTLSGIKFDQFGAATNQDTFICNNWVDGFLWAKNNQYKQVLFVKSGTIIKDWHRWQRLVNNYPHTGLIAHLIWHPEKDVYIDDQCWFMNIDQFTKDDFVCTTVTHPAPVRSEQNLHDDYTPLWIRAGQDNITTQVKNFGQGLIAKALQNNIHVLNWNKESRDLKFFLYGKKLDLSIFADYKHMAETQLWVFNNEPIHIVKKQTLLSPGSGLSWILNILDPNTKEMQIIDISTTQIKFCKTLWETWDGFDYGNFVWNFITQHNLIHYELDEHDMNALSRLKLRSKTKFIDYVNTKFHGMTNNTFIDDWNHAKQNKVVNFCNDNLITWVLRNNVDKYDNIWCSNILNYKWTLLHTTVEEYANFQMRIK